MKHVVESSQVAHLWAHQSQTDARNAGRGNIYFQGREIFSYGRHFCMGSIIEVGQSVILTNRTYSNTTAKHLGAVRYAVHHYAKKAYVRLPEGSVMDNLGDFVNQIKVDLETISNTRKRAHTRDAAKANLFSIASNIDLYFELKGITFDRVRKDCKRSLNEVIKAFPLYYEVAKNYEGSQDLFMKLDRMRKAVIRKETAKQKAALALWLQGSGTAWGIVSDKVYLRVNGEEVETSKGASVPLKDARVLYKAIKAGKDVRGFEIGNYTVKGINGVLTIGCHEIEREEIARFANSLNW